MGHKENIRCIMTDCELITTLIVSSLFFSGNIEKSRIFMKEHNYIPAMLEKSRFNRRQHSLGAEFIQDIMKIIAELFKNSTLEYAIDSFPISVCDNVRITRCRIYNEKIYRGYTRSKKRYFYGLKAHVIVTAEGVPVEFFLTPGSCNDCKALKMFEMDYPEGSTIYGDKGYIDYNEEDLLMEAAKIDLAIQRKKDTTRPHSGAKEYRINIKRKMVETSFSKISSFLPKKIHAVRSWGFEMKVALFICASTFSSLIQ